MANSLHDYLPLSVLFVFCKTTENPVLNSKQGGIRWLSWIDKKVYWIYNIYGIIMDTIKMRKRNKEKSFRNKSYRKGVTL